MRVWQFSNGHIFSSQNGSMKFEKVLANCECYGYQFDKSSWDMPMCSLDRNPHFSDSVSDFEDLFVKFRIEFFEWKISGHPEWA